jgi:hypothetical protein
MSGRPRVGCCTSTLSFRLFDYRIMLPEDLLFCRRCDSLREELTRGTADNQLGPLRRDGGYLIPKA